MSFLDYFQQQSRRDVVGIWKSDYEQAFTKSRPMKAVISEGSKNMEHPLETGAVIIDHRIVLPVTIDLELIMDGAVYYDQYNKIKQAFLNADLFFIHTKTGIYKNMMMTDIPHEESPSKYDTISMNIKFLEVQFVTAQFQPLPPAKVSKKTNQSTKDKGEVKPKEPTKDQVNSFIKTGKDAAIKWIGGK